ncbi:hypothetical protein [Aliivibrio fischeri]|uniref:hypothetical protein n=1 Tax=Aliivibrio fischeri TaxID=668 RepID=UPI0012D88DAF|nr:hypothetical protein [Aliivibrio fischeri]MUJ20612.1 hypothetical protein [Aliivibrio fischeri]
MSITGVSFTWLFIMLVALFMLAVLSPSGAKIALKEVVSEELFWSGSYLSLSLSLLSVVLYLLQDYLLGTVKYIYDLLPYVVSSIFGALFWILISLIYLKPGKAPWILITFGYLLLLLGLEYLWYIEAAFNVNDQELILTLIATNLLSFVLVFLSYLYFYKFVPAKKKIEVHT